MLSFLRHALMSPVTGPIATACAVALAIALSVSSAGWEAKRARYEARIVDLGQAAERTQVSLRSQIASCQAAGTARESIDPTYAASAGSTPEGAKRLLEQGPAGIDACARMESADRAVLSNLKR